MKRQLLRGLGALLALGSAAALAFGLGEATVGTLALVGLVGAFAPPISTLTLVLTVGFAGWGAASEGRLAVLALAIVLALAVWQIATFTTRLDSAAIVQDEAALSGAVLLRLAIFGAVSMALVLVVPLIGVNLRLMPAMLLTLLLIFGLSRLLRDVLAAS